MSLPVPRPGLVISYEYLWWREYTEGREYGVKPRPVVVVTALQSVGERLVVNVAPITHQRPQVEVLAVEILAATKQLLRLDEAPSWIIAEELNAFVWPGYDLSPLPSGGFVYGPLPPNLFVALRRKLAEAVAAERLHRVRR